MIKMPCNREAEANTLGAMILSESAIATVMQTATADEFFFQDHREIFRALKSLCEKNSAVDLVTVTAELRRTGTLDRVGGVKYIVQLCDNVASPSNARWYYEIVRGDAIKRRVIEIGRGIENSVDEKSADILLASLEESIMAISREKSVGMLDPVALAKEFRESQDIQIDPVSTPFQWLNDMTSGLLPGNLFTVAGRTSAGKSAFALQLAKGVSKTKKTCYISLEMPPSELLARYIASETDIPMRDIMLHKSDKSGMEPALTQYAESKLYFTATGRTTQEIDWLIKSHGFGIVFIDTINLVKSTGESERVKMLNITRELKQIALTNDTPVVMLAQLSRRTDEKLSPALGDIKESASIEEDSDVVLLLSEIESAEKLGKLGGIVSLPSEYEFSEMQRDGARLILAMIQKNRNGALGKTCYRFDGRWFRFTEMTGEYGGENELPF